MLKINFFKSLTLASIFVLSVPQISLAWNIKDVFNGMSTNITSPGSFRDQAAGYYAGGGASIRTSNTSFCPAALTPPSLKMSCNGIDATLGSFSLISGPELVNLSKNIGHQALPFGFMLGMKTFAPQIENTMRDLRNLSTQLSQLAKGDCELTKSIFAAALPKDTAMLENVCKEISMEAGMDYFGAQKKCKDNNEQKQRVQTAQNKNKDLLISNYNIFIKAANKINLPADLIEGMMSLTGTIVVKDGKVHFYDSLAKDERSWTAHLKGGEGASKYTCSDGTTDCLNVTASHNQTIAIASSYLEKVKTKTSALRDKFVANTAFTNDEINFLSSIGQYFPLYDYLTLEAISGFTILESSNEVVANYALISALKQITIEIRKSVVLLKSMQLVDTHVNEYLKALDKVLQFASDRELMLRGTANEIAMRAEKIEGHLIARERG